MKKTFLAKRNVLLSSTNLSWGMLALAGTLLVFCARLFVPNFFWHMAAPVFATADTLAADGNFFLASFNNAALLTEQNEKLVGENTALTNENQTLLQKVADLSALLDTPVSGKNNQGILAGVVARPPESPYDTLFLDKGSSAGVVAGQEAFGAGGVPVGVVTTVLVDFSQVRLFSSPGMVTHGWVGRANIPLTIIGTGAGTLSASFSRSSAIAVGDTVFAPGPGQLPIGRVTRVDSDHSSPQVVLRITPLVNPFSITWVELRTTGKMFFEALSTATSTP